MMGTKSFRKKHGDASLGEPSSEAATLNTVSSLVTWD